MASEDLIQLEGVIKSINRGGIFEVEASMGIPPNDTTYHVIARCSGKMKKYKIRMVLGDTVDLEVSPYDLEKGRITHRHR